MKERKLLMKVNSKILNIVKILKILHEDIVHEVLSYSYGWRRKEDNFIDKNNYDWLEN